MKFKERFYRFMAGRNGNDQLNAFLLGAALVLVVLGAFIKKGAVKSFVSLLIFALIAFIYYRMLSKDVYKRREENGRYMRARYALFGKLKTVKERWVQRKDYKFFTCPECKASLRVPKGHGKIKIVCRKCGNTFIGKS